MFFALDARRLITEGFASNSLSDRFSDQGFRTDFSQYKKEAVFFLLPPIASLMFLAWLTWKLITLP